MENSFPLVYWWYPKALWVFWIKCLDSALVHDFSAKTQETEIALTRTRVKCSAQKVSSPKSVG